MHDHQVAYARGALRVLCNEYGPRRIGDSTNMSPENIGGRGFHTQTFITRIGSILIYLFWLVFNGNTVDD